MRIILCYEYLLPTRGGAEKYIYDLINRLIKDNHLVHLIASQWDRSLPTGVHCHRVVSRPTPRLLRPWRFAYGCLQLLRYIPHDISIGFDKTWGQDILYPQGGLHLACADHNLLKYRSPVLRFFAKLGKRLDPAFWSFRMLEHKQYCSTYNPMIIVNSHLVRRHFETYYGISSERVRVVHSAIDSSRFSAEDRFRLRDEVRRRLGIASDAPVALFVAMNYRLKGLAPLLRALYYVTVPSLHLLVIGNPRYQRYRRLAWRLGLDDRVHFLGHQKEPRDYFFAADFLVHPTFYDPCSLVVLEALTCGLPVITTRYNGAAELLHPPAEGLIIDDPHNTPALSQAIQRMCDPVYRREAAMAARRRGMEWNFDRHYEALMNVFQEVCRHKSAA